LKTYSQAAVLSISIRVNPNSSWLNFQREIAVSSARFELERDSRCVGWCDEAAIFRDCVLRLGRPNNPVAAHEVSAPALRIPPAVWGGGGH